MKRIGHTLLFCIYFSVAIGQPKNLIDSGDKAYNRRNYKEAIQFYSQALKINPDNAELNYKLGSAYLYSDTKSKAAYYIDKAYSLNPKLGDRIEYRLGIAFQNTNEFKKAIEYFEAFGRNTPGVGNIVAERVRECKVADSLTNYELNVNITNLGDVVNSSFDEHSPIISQDGNTLIFTSMRGNVDKNGRRTEDIFVTTKQNGKWTEPKSISSNINTSYNDAAASLSPDGKTLFLYYETGAGDIYYSDFDGNDWSRPKPLNKNINHPEYWETCASLSLDRKRLYFASNRPGGYGDLDIYMCEMNNNGDWGKAINLGPVINSKGNDDSPYIHPDGVTLYFSSDGHPKMGNSDIFFSEFKNNKWTKPENIGYPINSWEYDGFFSVSPDKKTGYYATVKESGYGGIDIYHIEFLQPKYKPKPKPEPVVAEAPPPPKKVNTDFIDSTVQILKAQKIATLLRGKVIDERTAEPIGATISLVDNERNKVLAKISSDPETGEFELTIPHGGNYGVSSEMEGYLFNSINFNLPKFAEYQEVDMHIIMTPAQVGSKAILRNIFFDVGKSELKSQSISEVEKVATLLNTNPSLVVQINGHTDNTGNEATNKTLSLKRASSVVEYLIQQGISASRVSAKGFGSDRPIVSNDDEEGGREINRRTEIEILSTGN